MDNSGEVEKQKNSNLSIALIALNFILMLVLSTTFQPSGEFDGALVLLILPFSATILLGGYIYTYRGKGYRWAKILFIVLLVISIIFMGIFWYAWQLGHAFKN
ncbi:hypothetical protein H9X96_14615 [Pedobacter sp. N36a]|uniref:hypothetical protein n=1 Tax=Pedobacter sp. N36a TaxID=2767996 RepID=UPI0016572C73|nr:hypothetical protein [Pedobacter sp. N36a]MBC8987005.1 hypothetical protein [Pedobacter sp. N36a]